MAGFKNDVMYANNVDFTGSVSVTPQVTSNGQLLIGSTVSPNIRVGIPTSSNSSITITTGAGTLDFITNGSMIGNTITGDSGGALSPTAGNWNILGRAGSKTAGSGSTLTISSPPFSQVGTTSTSVLNSGEFVTAAVTRTLPATAGLVDGDLVIFACTTANALVITANTGQTIRIGTLVSSSAGTATSTAIGDSVTLRFNATAVQWHAVGAVGTWVMA